MLLSPSSLDPAVRRELERLAAIQAAAVTDHGSLTGLGDDDHTQYHNDTRGDARYLQIANNLSEGTASTMRTNLGLGTAALNNTGDFDAAGTAAAAVSAHEADTTAVHGIADTSLLLDTADIGVSVQAHATVLDNTTAAFTTAQETKLAGIETGATADQSAAEILAALITVDGTGSLLDADLLDGNEASAFATAGHTHAYSDHGALTGLADDDHTQYHNDTRGDARYAQKANNLSDLGSASTARTNLGLGTIATQAANSVAITGGSVTGISTLTVGTGGTFTQGGVTHLPHSAGTTAPSSPATGQLWYDTSGTFGVWKWWDGATWRLQAGSFTPYFHASQNATQSINHASVTQVNFGVEDYDVGGCFASNTFTVPTGWGGLWLLGSTGNWPSSSSVGGREWFFGYNGSGARYGHDVKPAYGNTGAVAVRHNISWMIPLSAGDTIRVYCYQSSGGALTIPANSATGGRCLFWGRYIGP